MGKGDWRRPRQISRDEEEKRYTELFGPPKLNNMTEEERAELEAERDALHTQSIESELGNQSLGQGD